MSPLLSLLPSLLLSCGDPPECDAERPCQGFGQVCVEGACQSHACATSASCPMESHCEGGQCEAGCAQDTDCYPGDACDPATGTCAEAACTDSHLDCAFQEFCDETAGECYAAEGYWCRPCVTNEDCGGNGNLCLGWGDNGDFCGVSCTGDVDCPSGYTCTVIDDAAGNPLGSQCITWCWLYEDLP